MNGNVKNPIHTEDDHLKSLNAMIENSQDAIIVLNSRGNVILINDTVASLFQLDNDEIIGRNLTDIFCRDKEDSSKKINVAELMKGINKEKNYIKLYLKKNKNEMFFEISPIEINRKKTYIMRGKHRKIASNETRTVETNHVKLMSLFDELVDGVITINSLGIIESFDHVSEKIFGSPAIEMIGKSITVLLPKKINLEENIGKTRLIDVKCKNGQIITVECTTRKYYIGKKSYFTSVFRDVADVQAKLNYMQRNTVSAIQIINMAEDSIIAMDKNCNIQIMNPAALKMFEYTLSEVMYKNINILMPPPYKNKHTLYVQKYFETGEKKIIGKGARVHGLTKTRRLIPIQLNVSEYYVGTQKYFVGFLYDLTDTLLAEKKLTDINDNLLRQNQLQEGQVNLFQLSKKKNKIDELYQNILQLVIEHNELLRGYIIEENAGKYKLKNEYLRNQEPENINPDTLIDMIQSKCLVDKVTYINKENPSIENTSNLSLKNDIAVLSIEISSQVKIMFVLVSNIYFRKNQKYYIDGIWETLSIILINKSIKENEQAILKDLKNKQNILIHNKTILEVSNETLVSKTKELMQQKKINEYFSRQIFLNRNELQEKKEKLIESNKSLQKSRKEVRQKAAALEKSNKYKSEFLANMSHELRTPLNSILILSEILSENRDKNLSQREIDNIKTIYNSGKDLLEIINDILDISKVEAGKIKITLDEILLFEEIEENMNLFYNLIKKKNIDFRLKWLIDKDQKIITDRLRFSQIMKNLISNAYAFTEKGSIELYIRKPKNNEIKNVADKAIAIDIKDSGIGICKEDQEKIFEAFEQVYDDKSHKRMGTGLGLSISKKLVELLGGIIKLESNKGEGSIFTIILPIDSRIINLSEHAISSNVTIKIKKNNRKYLLVHDDMPVVYRLRKKLFQNGYYSDLALNYEGINMILKENDEFSSIVISYELAINNNWEIINLLYQNNKAKQKDIYIIGSTKNAEKRVKKQFTNIVYLDESVIGSDSNKEMQIWLEQNDR